MNRYNLALFLLSLALVPLFYVSGWLLALALVAIYGLMTRLANKDFDRRSGRGSILHPAALHRINPSQELLAQRESNSGSSRGSRGGKPRPQTVQSGAFLPIDPTDDSQDRS